MTRKVSKTRVLLSSRALRCGPSMDEEDTHALAYPWTFTYFKKVANKSYEENTYTLGTTSTVRPAAAARATKHLSRARAARGTHQGGNASAPVAGGGLWRLYVHLAARHGLCDYHVFAAANVGGRGQCETPSRARPSGALHRSAPRPAHELVRA